MFPSFLTPKPPSPTQKADGSSFARRFLPRRGGGGEEAGADEDSTNYGIKFQIMKKVDVNGDSADPLWEHVKKEKPGLAGMKRVYVSLSKRSDGVVLMGTAGNGTMRSS